MAHFCKFCLVKLSLEFVSEAETSWGQAVEDERNNIRPSLQIFNENIAKGDSRRWKTTVLPSMYKCVGNFVVYCDRESR